MWDRDVASGAGVREWCLRSIGGRGRERG